MLSFLRSQIEGRVCGKAAEMGEQEGWARITALKELKGEVRPPARRGRGSACAARAGASRGVWLCAHLGAWLTRRARRRRCRRARATARWRCMT